MARKGRINRITKTTTDPEAKEFQDSPIEGAKVSGSETPGSKTTKKGESAHAISNH